jgi:hypothetical protein
MKREIAFALIDTVPSVLPSASRIALTEALHLDQPAPGEGRRDREPSQRVGGGGRRRGCAGHPRVDVDELGAERAAEGLGEVARLRAEDHVGAGVENLELLDVERAWVEAGDTIPSAAAGSSASFSPAIRSRRSRRGSGRRSPRGRGEGRVHLRTVEVDRAGRLTAGFVNTAAKALLPDLDGAVGEA